MSLLRSVAIQIEFDIHPSLDTPACILHGKHAAGLFSFQARHLMSHSPFGVIAVIAQLVARRSHNPKVVSAILTDRILTPLSLPQPHACRKHAHCRFFGLIIAISDYSIAKPPVGFEPTTSRLLSGCSTN